VAKATSNQLHQLRHLTDQPQAQAALAATLLNPRLGHETVGAALRVLSKTPHAQARSALLALYIHYEEKGRERDPAGNLRGAVLRALRAIVQPGDVPLLTTAAATYLFPPPSFKEEGASLRSAALHALSEVDETLARYHAVRLLANEHTDEMSGEPALTAARLLASYSEVSALYFYVMQDGARTLPEVLAECLRHLTTLPDALIPGVLERFAKSEQEIVLVGLFDLLINHRTGPHGRDFLHTFLRTTQREDVYRYLVTIMVAAGRPALLDDLIQVARQEQQPAKLTMLIDALAIRQGATVIDLLVEELRARRRAKTVKQ
jgi:hypothetical protein